MRFAETAGHEFDYDIVNAFRYRDYVIRAFNVDLPFHQFVTEQLAGDLLDSPRRHPDSGVNESIVGTGFYFLGEGTHSPVDVREEQMRRIDNQIDVISKAFLGLTIACARCHDHKFDPIRIKTIMPSPGSSQLAASAGIDRRASSGPAGTPSGSRAARKRSPACWPRVANHDWNRSPAASPPAPETERDQSVFEDFNRDSFDGWFVTGNAFGARPSQPGDLRLEPADGASKLTAVAPGQAHSGLVSDRLRGVLRSRSFTIESRFIHWLVSGRGGQDQRRCRRLREDSRSDLRGLDAENRCRRPAPLDHAGSRHVAGPFGLPRDQRRRDHRLRWGQCQSDDGAGQIAVDEIRMSNQPPPAIPDPDSPAPLDLGTDVCGPENRREWSPGRSAGRDRRNSAR